MAPQLGFPHARLGQVRRLLAARFDDAAADVGAADVDGENGVVTFEDPGRGEVQRADQAGVVGVMADRQHLDLEVLVLEDDFGARDGEFAEPAIAKTAAHHDALGLLPGLGLEETARDVGEFLCEVLDGAVNDRRGLGVVADQDGVEHLLADVFGWLLPERIFAGFAQRLPPPVENVPESALAGAVSEESFLVLQFDVEAVDLHRREAGGAVSGDAGGRDRFVGHPEPSSCDDRRLA